MYYSISLLTPRINCDEQLGNLQQGPIAAMLFSRSPRNGGLGTSGYQIVWDYEVSQQFISSSFILLTYP